MFDDSMICVIVAKFLEEDPLHIHY